MVVAGINLTWDVWGRARMYRLVSSCVESYGVALSYIGLDGAQ